MEQQWTKKRILQLNGADEQVIEQWLDEYIHVIYTWLYYQVGADAEIAADLTGRTFKQAVESLATFDPDTETMLEWLRIQGRRVRDEVLEIRGIKPQRPWAWTQFPDHILCGLSHLRDEPLSENITNNPFVREIIQAALAEMEGPNRKLMMQRYNQLDTAEHIAAETNQNVADVNDRLYRCRHTFRRIFIQLIQSANQGFSESSAAGNLELLDANLEKLLSSTNMVQIVSPKEQAKLREIVLAAARETTPLRSPNNTQQTTLIAVSVIVLIVVLIITGAVLWLNKPTETIEKPESTATSQPDTSASASPSSEKKLVPAEEEIDQEELERILKRVLSLGEAGDLSGLLDVLKNGQYTTQIAAAHFIGKLGDESSIGMLEEAEMRWYPDGPENNPFSDAILQIENRLLNESNVIIEEPNDTDVQIPVEKTIEPESAQESAPRTIIHGTVRDASGQPLPGAQLTLLANPLYDNTANIRVIMQVSSNQTGVYEFTNPPEGAYFIDFRDTVNNLSISRSIWYGADGQCTVDFGGNSVVSGVLADDLADAAGRILYLSDTLNPADASFRAECVTDTNGVFSFAGIQAGSYYLLDSTDTNGIIWLEAVEVGQQDIVNRQINIQQASVTVNVETNENTPAVLEVYLAYGTDEAEQMQQFPLDLQDDGSFAADMVPFSSYTLITTFENAMRLQQPLDVNADRELTVTAPAGECMLSGSFRNFTPYNFFLYNTDQRVRFNLGAAGDGPYDLDAVPADTYTLGAIVNGLQLDFMKIDLQSEPEQILDIDASQLLGDLSPLYVAVTDTQGAMISQAQVWVTGPGEVVTTQSTGRGAFLALEPGEYTLFGALPGYSTAEEVIQVQPMPLETPPNPDNTIRLQLKAP